MVTRARVLELALAFVGGKSVGGDVNTVYVDNQGVEMDEDTVSMLPYDEQFMAFLAIKGDQESLEVLELVKQDYDAGKSFEVCSNGQVLDAKIFQLALEFTGTHKMFNSYVRNGETLTDEDVCMLPYSIIELLCENPSEENEAMRSRLHNIYLDESEQEQFKPYI